MRALKRSFLEASPDSDVFHRLRTQSLPDLFMLMLVLDETATFDAGDLTDALVRNRPSTFLNAVSAGGGSDPIMITVDSVPVTLMSIAAPIPSAALDLPLRATPWAEAAACVSRSRAHVVVSALKAGQSLAERVAIAHAVTDVAACAAGLARTSAVYVVSAGALYPPFFLSSAANSGEKAAPLLFWMRLHFREEPRRGDGSVIECWTSGLAYFVGREIEFGQTIIPAARLSDYVLGVAQLLLSGSKIDDGHTVSLEGVASMVQVSIMPQGLLQSRPAYHLSAVARA